MYVLVFFTWAVNKSIRIVNHKFAKYEAGLLNFALKLMLFVRNILYLSLYCITFLTVCLLSFLNIILTG